MAASVVVFVDLVAGFCRDGLLARGHTAVVTECSGSVEWDSPTTPSPVLIASA